MEKGETSTRQFKRGDVPFHLLDHCPLQIVKCPYWDFGCRDEMERKFILERKAACTTLANILLKAHVLNVSDKEKSLGCLRRQDKLSN